MGRDSLGGIPLPDDQVSREHAQVMFDGRQFQLTDQKSRNGTFLDGKRINGTVACGPGSLIRIGRTMLRTVLDIRPLASASVVPTDGYVVGPALRTVLDRIQRSATGGANVLITGENGTGKERAANVFHKAAAPRGPMVPVNCATLPAGTADSQLFGSGDKVYTGVKGHPGFIEKADGGVLFLDEVGDLPEETQAKLLRVVETGEVLRSGETEPRKVNVRYVCATNRDIRAQIAAGTFREDLFHRLAHFEVHIPPLHERVEEIPYLIHVELEAAGRIGHHELVELALLLPWSGNVRQLISKIRAARLVAKHDTLVRREDLEEVLATPAPANAAVAINRTQPAIMAWQAAAPPLAGPVQATSPSMPAYDGPKPAAKDRDPGKDKLLELKAAHGSWSEVARALGEKRNTVNRWRKAYGLMAADEPEADDAAD